MKFPLNRASRTPRAFTLAELIVVCLIVAIVIAIAIPIFNTREAPVPRIRCLSNLRAIGNALMQYAQENNGVYPARLADVCAMGMTPDMLVCSASKTETPAAQGPTTQQTLNNVLAGNNHITYVYLAAGSQKSSLKPLAVIAYEPIAIHGESPKSSGNVLFADGHVASLPADVFAQMITQLNAGQNPPPATAGN